jgi:hypothetical protein
MSGERRPRQHEAELLAARVLMRREVEPRRLRDVGGLARDLFAFDEAVEGEAGDAAGRINRGDLAAQSPDDPRYVDAAAARVVTGCRAA